jgi:hypothetical protein
MGEVTWFSPSGWLIGLRTTIYQHYARLKKPDFANSINKCAIRGNKRGWVRPDESE